MKMNNISEIFAGFLSGEYDTQTAINMLRDINILRDEKNTKKLSDSDMVKQIIMRLDGESSREDIWEVFLKYIDVSIFDDYCFDYFYENDISLNTLAHLDLQDKYLKILLRDYDEAYIFLARRYYDNNRYSVYDFADLISKCRYESVFYDLLLYEGDINPKSNVLHKVIQNSAYLSRELKSFSQRIYEAKMLFCTDDIEMIEAYFNKNDHIYFAAISNNVSTPDNILRALMQVSDIKFAARIREKSKETLRIKSMLSRQDKSGNK